MQKAPMQLIDHSYKAYRHSQSHSVSENGKKGDYNTKAGMVH